MTKKGSRQAPPERLELGQINEASELEPVGDDMLEELAKKHWGEHIAPLLAAPDPSPATTPTPSPPRRKGPKRLTPSQLAGIWKRSQKDLAPSRGTWRWRAMAPVQSGPPLDAFLRAVGMIEGVPADYSISAQQVLHYVAITPGAMAMATPYLALAYRRLLMADHSASWPVPLDDDMARAAKLFQTRKEALAFIESLVALGGSLRFSAQEQPLMSAPRPEGRPSLFPPGGLERLYSEFCTVAQAAQSAYRAGQRSPETVRFAGVRTKNRRSGWVAIWQHGWPRAWTIEMLSIVLDVKKHYLQKNL